MLEQAPQLKDGEEITVEAGKVIYGKDDEPSAKPFYYIIAGLVRMEFRTIDDYLFTHYLQPNHFFGIVEPLAGCNRLTNIVASERTLLYRWDTENFYNTVSISYELASISLTSLIRILRIFNAEFGEKIGLRSNGKQ